MASENRDVLTLHARGKASTSEHGRTIRLRAEDPICALQAIAHQAKLRIALTPAEIEQLTRAGPLPIRLTYPNHLAGASAAARKVCEQACASLGEQPKRPRWRRALAVVAAFVVLGVLAFVIVYWALAFLNGG